MAVRRFKQRLYHDLSLVLQPNGDGYAAARRLRCYLQIAKAETSYFGGARPRRRFRRAIAERYRDMISAAVKLGESTNDAVGWVRDAAEA